MPGTAYNLLQNPKMYEALRRQGYSKTAAAKISNARTRGRRVAHKADYGAGVGGQIAGNLYRGAGGRFTAGSGGNLTPAQQRQNARQQERANYGRAEDALRQAEDEAIAKEPNRHKRAALKRATIIARRQRLYARREQRRQLDEQDQFARNQEAQERARRTAERRAQRVAEVLARREANARAREERNRKRDEERSARERQRDDDKRKRDAEREAKRHAAEAKKRQDQADEDAFRDIEDQLLEAAPDAKTRAALRRRFVRERRERKARRRTGERVQPPKQTEPRRERIPQVPLPKRSPRGPMKPGIPGSKSFAVYKDAQDSYRWVAISSTAYRDRDGEIISTKALIGAVEKGDTTGERGVLRYWHVPGLDLGVCDYQAYAFGGKLLIESGTFYRPDYAIALKERGAGWGVSPGFLHSPDQPDRHGVFHDITIFERSICPPGKASNLFTSITTKESRMSLTPDKDTQLAALLGGRDSAAYKAALSTMAETEKTAQASGVTFKSADEPEAYEIEGNAYTVKEGKLVQVDRYDIEFQGKPLSVAKIGDRFVALKAMKPLTDPPPVSEAKADMPAAEMIEAGETEAEDGEMDMADEPLLGPSDLAAIEKVLRAIIEPMFEIQKQVGDLKSVLSGMGTGQAVATKAEQPDQNAIAQMIAAYQASNQTVKQAAETIQATRGTGEAQPSTAELMAQIAQLQQTVKTLQGEQPLAATNRASQASETVVGADNPLMAGYKEVGDDPQSVVDSFLNGFRPA